MREMTKAQMDAARAEFTAAKEAKELAVTLGNKLDGWQFHVHDQAEYDRLFSLACILKTKVENLRTAGKMEAWA